MSEMYSVFNPETQKLLDNERKGEIMGKLTRSLHIVEIGRTLGGIAKEGMENRTLSQAEQDIMEVLHGEYARPLGDKSKFPHLLRSIGYTAPDSVVVQHADMSSARLAEVKAYYHNQNIDHVFCKPVNGSRQRDLYDFSIDTPQFEAHMSQTAGLEDMLVQEYKPHEQVLRYIRYKDESGKSFVGCFKYDEDISQQREPYDLLLVGQRKLPGSGETVNELATNMRDTVAIPLSDDQDQLSNLNRFMDTAIAKLELALGGPLPFFTCDIGIEHMADLEGDYDEAKLKKSVIFFESQGLPNPWAGINKEDKSNLVAYINVWRLFLKEHGDDMVKRARKVRKMRKHNK